MSGDSGATAEQIARMRERADEITSRIKRMTSSFDSIAAEAQAIEVTASSADGLVVATVGVDGRLRALHLNSRIYHQPDAEDLARSIRETIDAATDEAQRRALALYQPLLPADTLSSLAERDPKKLLTSLVGSLSTLKGGADGQ